MVWTISRKYRITPPATKHRVSPLLTTCAIVGFPEHHPVPRSRRLCERHSGASQRNPRLPRETGLLPILAWAGLDTQFHGLLVRRLHVRVHARPSQEGYYSVRSFPSRQVMGRTHDSIVASKGVNGSLLESASLGFGSW